MASDPRVFAFSLERRIASQEIPLSWLEQRYDRMPNAERALEVAPGVRVTLMGTGDILLPDGECCRGAQIAVWVDVRPVSDQGYSDRFFGRRLRHARQLAAMRQQDLADAMNALGQTMYRSTIGKIESGERPATITEAFFLARMLGISLAELAGDVPDEQDEQTAVKLAARALRNEIAGHDAVIDRLSDARETAKSRLADLEAALTAGNADD